MGKLILWAVSLVPLLLWFSSYLLDVRDSGWAFPSSFAIMHGFMASLAWFGFVWFIYLVFLIFFVWPWEKEGSKNSDTAQDTPDTKAESPK